MHARHWVIVGLLSGLLFVNGCSRSSTQSETSPVSGEGTSAAQSSANNVNPVQNPANTSAGAAPMGTQSTRVEDPPTLVIPAGTSITVCLQQRLSSASAVPGERFEAVVDEPVVAGNQLVVPVGSPVEGHVIAVRHSGRLHHPGELGLTLDRVTVNQQLVELHTLNVVARGGSHKKRNWGWIGGGAGGGAAIGALAAGGSGALIGTGIGAAAGTTTALITGKKDVVFRSERRLRFCLNHNTGLFG